MIFRSAFLSLCLLTVTAAVRAQVPGAPKEPPVEFRAIAWNRDFPDVFYEIKGTEQPLPLHRGVITRPQSITGAPKLVLYRPTLIEGKPGKAPIVELALHLPPKKNLIVVWLEKNGRIGATVLADEPGRPAPGSVRFVNLAGRQLALN